MAISLKIDGTERVSYVAPKSLHITKYGSGNNVCSFTLHTTATDFIPAEGEEVLIYDDAALVYGGLIKAFFINKMTPAMGNTADIEITVNCTGYNEIPSRRTIAAEYTGQTSGYIVEALRALTIIDEGVGAGTIDAGITIPYFLQICVSLKEIYDELAKSSGYKWYIDESKDLQYLAEDAIVDADEDLVEGGSFTDFDNIKYKVSMQDYANKVFVKGRWGVDGALLYLSVEDATEIAARAVIEGGSGVHGIVIEDRNITTEAEAETLANLYLKMHCFTPADLSFTSFKTDWVGGTRLKVNLPAVGIGTDTYFLIEEVTIVRVDTDLLMSKIRCTKRQAGLDFSTQKNQSGTEYFVKLVREAKKSGGGGSNIEVNTVSGIKAYRDSNVALVNSTTAETTVCSKSITTQYAADFHVTFSAEIDYDADVILNAQLFVLEPGSTAAYAMDFKPTLNLEYSS